MSDEVVAKMIPQRSFAYNKVEREERVTGYEQRKQLAPRQHSILVYFPYPWRFSIEPSSGFSTKTVDGLPVNFVVRDLTSKLSELPFG
jgi:hypothetical protein